MPSTLPPLRPYFIDSAEQELQADFVAAINRVLYDIAHELNEQLARDRNPGQPKSTSSDGACDDVQQLPIRFVFSKDQLDGLPPAQDCITVTPVPFRLNRNRRAWSQCAVLDWRLKDRDTAVNFHFPTEAFLAGHLYQCLAGRENLGLHVFCITGAGSSPDRDMRSEYYEYALWVEQEGEHPTRDDARARKLEQREPPEWRSPDRKDSDYQQLRRLYLDWINEIDEWCQRFIILLPVYDTRPYGHAFGDVAASLMLNVGVRSLGHTSGSILEPAARQKYLRACEVVVERTATQLNRLTELIAAEIHKAAIIQASTQQPKWNHDLLEHFVITLRFAQSWEAAHVYKDDRYLYSYGWTHNEELSGKDEWERQVTTSDDWLQKRSPRALFAPNGTPASIDLVLGHSDSSGSSVQVVTDEAIRWDTPGFYSSNGNGLDDLQELAGVQIIFEFTKTARIPGPDSQYRRAFCRELQYQQLDVIRTIRPAVRMRRAAVRNAVSAIMGRNMSHNIGSHVLSRLAAAELDAQPFDLHAAARAREGLLSYLQQRMDFVAEVSTVDKAYWSQPLTLRDVVGRLNFAEQYKVIARQELHAVGNSLAEQVRVLGRENRPRPLLLSYITGKHDLAASVAYGNPGQNQSVNDRVPIIFSCPGGEVGAHALLVILENIIRNSARHGQSSSGTIDPVVLHVYPVEVGQAHADTDLIEIRIVDLNTLLPPNGASTNGKPSAEKTINEALAKESLIDPEGRPNPKNWGVREMQICAHYLRGRQLSKLESFQASGEPPIIEARRETLQTDAGKADFLAYTLFLQRPRLLAVLVSEGHAGFPEVPPGVGVKLVTVPRSPSADAVLSAIPDVSGYLALIYAEALEPTIESAEYRASLPMLRLAADHDTVTTIVAAIAADSEPEKLAWLEPVFTAIYRRILSRRPALEGKTLHGLWIVPGEGNNPNEQANLVVESIVCAQRDDSPRGCPPIGRRWKAVLNELIEGRNSSFLGVAWIDHPRKDEFSDSAWGFWQSYKLTGSPDTPGLWLSIEPDFYECAHHKQRDLVVRDNMMQGLLCAAALRIAVLDERVQAALDSEFRQIPLRQLWAGMGVWVPEQSVCNLDKPMWEACRSFLDRPTPLEWQWPIDIVVIHLTVLEALRNTHFPSRSLDVCLDALRAGTQASGRSVEFVVVTGRGVTGTTMSHKSDQIRSARYLPISALQEHLLTRPSKLGLARALWNSRRV